MELSEFRIWLEDRIAMFEREWRLGHRTDPSAYPISLHSASDWYEHFNAYLNSEEDSTL